MSLLQKTDQVYLNKEDFKNAFLFNNINIYDLFIYSCYPNQYYMNVHCGKYELGIVKDIIEPAIVAAQGRGNILTANDSNGIIQKALGKSYNQIDKNNIDQILDNLGMSETLNTLLKGMTSSLKIGEEKNVDISKNFGIKNKANSEKYKTVYKFSVRLSVFILSLIHDLYWDQFTTNDPAENINNILSGKTVDNCYKSVIDVSKQLLNLFNEMIDRKYPNALAISSIQLDFDKEKLEQRNIMENVAKVSKSKKSKKSKKYKD